MLTKGNVKIGLNWRFGPDWPGQRCEAQTRRGTLCQRPGTKRNGRCGLHGGNSTGPRTKNRGLLRSIQTIETRKAHPWGTPNQVPRASDLGPFSAGVIDSFGGGCL